MDSELASRGHGASWSNAKKPKVKLMTERPTRTIGISWLTMPGVGLLPTHHQPATIHTSAMLRKFVGYIPQTRSACATDGSWSRRHCFGLVAHESAARCRSARVTVRPTTDHCHDLATWLAALATIRASVSSPGLTGNDIRERQIAATMAAFLVPWWPPRTGSRRKS